MRRWVCEAQSLPVEARRIYMITEVLPDSYPDVPLITTYLPKEQGFLDKLRNKKDYEYIAEYSHIITWPSVKLFLKKSLKN